MLNATPLEHITRDNQILTPILVQLLVGIASAIQPYLVMDVLTYLVVRHCPKHTFQEVPPRTRCVIVKVPTKELEEQAHNFTPYNRSHILPQCQSRRIEVPGLL